MLVVRLWLIALQYYKLSCSIFTIKKTISFKPSSSLTMKCSFGPFGHISKGEEKFAKVLIEGHEHNAASRIRFSVVSSSVIY